jgi:hypothetical protein
LLVYLKTDISTTLRSGTFNEILEKNLEKNINLNKLFSDAIIIGILQHEADNLLQKILYMKLKF